MKLLNDLVQNIPEKQLPIRAGRPELSMQDMVFGSALKVFTTFSLRRFMTDANEAKVRGYLQHIPHFTLVSVYMKKEEMTPFLQDLIMLSALPMKAVETKFAIDSTGFRTTKFGEYCKEKHNTGRDHDWIKAHICSGVSTHIITGVEVLPENSGDSPQFIPLAEKTHNAGFTIDEMSADKAYSSRDNNAYIDQIGGTPYIAFRSNATGKPRGNNHIWRKMYNYFVYNREDFLQHYHLRSNVESTNNMIKSKTTDMVRSKDKTAQINEVLLKVLCHNICVLISAMFELGIEPNLVS
jgi:transposase